MSHPDAETLMRYEEGLLSRDAAAEVAAHVVSCHDCAHTSSSMHAFGANLRERWLSARLKKVVPSEWGCLSESELSTYFLGELDGEQAEGYRRHIEACSRCRSVLEQMDHESTALARSDPLGSRGNVDGRGWLAWLRAAVQPVPALALVAASVVACLAFMAGLFIGPGLLGPGQPSPEVRIAKPPFTPPPESPALGVAPSVKPEAGQRFREAMQFYGERDFADHAIPKLKEAVAADPGYEPAQFWLGIAYLLKGDVPAALRHLEEAAKLAPGNVQYKHYLVWAYLKAGRRGEALLLQTEILRRAR